MAMRAESSLVRSKSRRLRSTMGVAPFEPLEARRLLALIPITPGELPDISFNTVGTVNYTFDAVAQEGLFSVNAAPVDVMFDPFAFPELVSDATTAPKSVQINFRVNPTGDVIGGVAGPDLLVVGQVFDGVTLHDGELLRGEIADFGFLDTGTTTDEYDFRFTVDSANPGLLGSYFAGKDIGVIVRSINSTFVGLFTQDFSGGANGNIFPIEKPVVHLEGRMTGGGSIFLPEGGVGGPAGMRITHGFQLHCAHPPQEVNNRLEVNWNRPDSHFHLLFLTEVECFETEIVQEPRQAPIDTMVGKGFGRFTGTFGGIRYLNVDAEIEFILTDGGPTRGEPGVDDTAHFRIVVLDANKDGIADDPVVVLNTLEPQLLRFGNHQAHPEIPPYSTAGVLSGTVFVDANKNGVLDAGEALLAGVEVTLQGQDFNGKSVVRTTTTDSNGVYSFKNLKPGLYQVTQSVPAEFMTWAATTGTMGGGVNGVMFYNIISPEDVEAAGYHYGLTTSVAGRVASLNFWVGATGQDLIKRLGARNTTLGDWLASNFSNIYGKDAGLNNFSKKTQAYVADRLLAMYNATPEKLDARVLSMALSIYAQTDTLNTTAAGRSAAISSGFIISSESNPKNLRNITWNLSDDGEAFAINGGKKRGWISADHELLTTWDLLVRANAHASKGWLWNEGRTIDGVFYSSSTLQLQALSVFSIIDELQDAIK